MKSLSRVQASVAGVVATALIGGVVGVAGGIATASTEVVTAPLAAPTALTPDDSVTPYPHTVAKTVRLDWSPVAGATGYRVEVGTDNTWSDDPVLTRDVFYSELTLPLWLPNATYAWRVAALKGSAVGHWSSESTQAHSDATFTKGWRVAPTLNPVTSPFVGDPTFSWSPVAEASGYELQVSRKSFAVAASGTAPSPDTTPSAVTDYQAPPQPDTLLVDCMTPRTRVTPYGDVVGKSDSVGDCDFNPAPPGTTVYWRVRALDAYVGAGATVSTTPVAANGVSYQPPSTLSTKSDLIAACPNPPASPSPSPSATATTSPSPTPASTIVPLSCNATRPSVLSFWSAEGSFAYNRLVPSGVAGTQPTTDSLASEPDQLCTVSNPGSSEAEHALCRDIPTLRWTAVAGMSTYRVVIALDDAFTNIQNEMETSALEWTPLGSFRDSPAGTTYYYAVQACDDTSCGPVPPKPASFSKGTPRPTVGAKPAVAGEMKLSWQSYGSSLKTATGSPETQDAYAYHVQVATADHPTYDQLVDDEVVDETYLSPAKSYGDGDFVWRVQPLDSLGNRLPYSLSQAFTRDATPPRIVSVTPSVKVAVKAPLKLVFSEPVTGLSSSTVTLSPAASTTLSVTSSTTATLVPTTGLRPGATYTVLVGSAVKDLSGNSALAVGPSLTVNPFVDDKSTAVGYAGTWHTLSSSNAVGGTYHGAVPTATSHPYATLSFTGTGISLTACVGPSNGYVDLYVDGAKKARVSTYRSFSGCGVKVAALTGFTRAVHTFKVVGVGAHVSASKGNGVGLDALNVTP